MGLQSVGKENPKTSNGENDFNESSSESSTEQSKLMNQFTSMRDSIISMVKNRFPMKGIDTIIKQAFDEAVTRNLEDIKKQFLKTFQAKFHRNKTEIETSKQSKNIETYKEELNNLRNKSDLSQNTPAVSTSINRTASIPIHSTKSSNVNSIELDYQKRIDQLILEIKNRDKKLKEKEEHIETLKNRLEILEQQILPPFIEDWKIGREYGEGEVEQLQNQIKRWEMLWQKLKPFFGSDPKFKTLFILQRLGNISVNNLSKALNLDSNQTEKLLQQLQESSLVRIEGDRVRINSDD